MIPIDHCMVSNGIRVVTAQPGSPSFLIIHRLSNWKSGRGVANLGPEESLRENSVVPPGSNAPSGLDFRTKANAARASHPSRIVVANILPAVFR